MNKSVSKFDILDVIFYNVDLHVFQNPKGDYKD